MILIAQTKENGKCRLFQCFTGLLFACILSIISITTCLIFMLSALIHKYGDVFVHGAPRLRSRNSEVKSRNRNACVGQENADRSFSSSMADSCVFHSGFRILSSDYLSSYDIGARSSLLTFQAVTQLLKFRC